MLGGQGTFRLKWEIANEFGLLQDNYSCKSCGLDSWILGYEKSHTAKCLDTKSYHPENQTQCLKWTNICTRNPEV